MKIYRIIPILSIAFLASCSPKYYAPTTQNAPLFTEKGESSIAVTGSGNQVELQAAYALGTNFAIQANGGLFIPSDLDNGNGGSGNYGEFGLGYFKPLKGNMVFETYGILGFGSVENHFPSTVSSNPGTTGDISAGITRFGIQPNIGYKSNRFSASLSSRFVQMQYSNIKGSLVFDGEDQVNYLKNNKAHFLIEPAITLRYGFEKIKLQLQYGHSLNMTNSDFQQDNSYLTLGFQLSLR